MKTALQLQHRLVAFISGARDDFDTLALEVFAFQFARNPLYRAFCEMKNLVPDNVAHWSKIPAVPTRAFKDMPVTCFPVSEAVAEFRTSGTTTTQPGRHLFKTLELYNAAIPGNFAAHLFPDSARMPLLSLVPDDPHSSLAHMIRVLGARCVEQLEAVEQPVCVLGTAFGFLNLFDAGIELRLPPGSRAMETGGFKGRAREVSKTDLYEMFEKYLGIPATHVVNEYGMTELSTQFYDATLREGCRTDLKIVPPWARVLVINPETNEPAPEGKPGLIRVFDLANLWSAMCIQTEDLGIQYGNRFQVLGRAVGAESRGCSLNAEALATA